MGLTRAQRREETARTSGDEPRRHGERADRTSFEDLYTAEFDVVRAWLARNSRPDGDADDLAAEVFTKALRGWESYRGDASRRSWLFTIARNTLLNWRRSRARDPQVPTDAPPEGAADAADVPAEQRAALDALLARIPTTTARRAVELRYVEGRTVDEVAAALGLSPTAVTSLTYRALRALREEMS